MSRYDDSNMRSMLAGMRDRRQKVQHLLAKNELVRKQFGTRRFADGGEDDGPAIDAHPEAHLLLTNRRLIYFPDEGPVEEFPFSAITALTEKELRRGYAVIELTPAVGEIQRFVTLPSNARASAKYFHRFEKTGDRDDVLERFTALRKRLGTRD